MPDIHLKVENISKSFENVDAVKDVSIEFFKGEIHSIIGENGAGKSTLMNLITGLLEPDTGKIYYWEKPVELSSPADSLAMGIGIVHQHFMLIEEFTALENIILGNEVNKGIFLDKQISVDRITKLKEDYGFTFPLDKKVSELTVGEKQQIEILKILYRDAEFFIFDEPTAVLTLMEVDGLYKIFRRLKENGKTIVFISHKLKEIFSISDRISIMRTGELIYTDSAKQITPEEIAVKMVGQEIKSYEIKKTDPGEIILKLNHVNCQVKGGNELKNLDLTIRRGEIVGIAGVEGNGQDELVMAILGLLKTNSGEINFEGENINNLTTEQRLNLGISIIPADRLKTGAVQGFSLKENVFLGLHNFPEFRKGIFINAETRDQYSEKIINDFKVKAYDINQNFGNLSGGNQQKVVVGKTVFKLPKLFIAHHPTRGLDISAMQFVHSILGDLKLKNVGILLISSDLDELLKLSDQVKVMFKGEILESSDAHKIDIEQICKLMAGVHD